MELWRTTDDTDDTDGPVLVLLERDPQQAGGLDLTVSDLDNNEWTVHLSPAAVRELRDALNRLQT